MDPDKSGSSLDLRLVFNHVPANAPVTLSVVDADHGNAVTSYRALGSPQYPTKEQIRRINAATALPTPAQLHLDGTHLDLELQINALALIEITAKP